MGCTRGGFYTLNLERIPRIFELDSNALAITHQYREDGLFKTGRLSIVVIRQLTFVERKQGFDTRWSGTSSGISIEFTWTRASNAAEQIQLHRVYFTLVQRGVQAQNYDNLSFKNHGAWVSFTDDHLRVRGFPIITGKLEIQIQNFVLQHHANAANDGPSSRVTPTVNS